MSLSDTIDFTANDKLKLPRTPKGYASRKAIGATVVLFTGATTTISDVRGKTIEFANRLTGYIGHIMSVEKLP